MAGQRYPPVTRERRVFDSIFGSSKLSLPTPAATPNTPFTQPGEAFGGITDPDQLKHISSTSSDGAGHVQRQQAAWDRAWHAVTAYLLLGPFDEQVDPLVQLDVEPEAPSHDVREALRDVVQHEERLPLAGHTEDLVEWHTRQARVHFISHVLPRLRFITGQLGSEDVLKGCLHLLHAVQRRYLHGLAFISGAIDTSRGGSASSMLHKFTRVINAVISNALFKDLEPMLRDVLGQYIRKVLGLPSSPIHDRRIAMPSDAQANKICRQLLSLVRSLHRVGLSGEGFEIIFAELMDDAMDQFVYFAFKDMWQQRDDQGRDGISAAEDKSSFLPKAVHHTTPSACTLAMCEWVEERFTKLVVLVFDIIEDVEVTWNDKERWRETGVGRLAALRISELFDIVKHWPDNDGALHDLRTAVTTPRRRLHLTEVFAKSLQRNILHPGTSTLQILQMYISMIWSFHSLDHSKVLLDRVAYPLQVYLGGREDTVRIIVSGLLADVEDGTSPDGDKLSELARILHQDSQQSQKSKVDEGLDWHDPEWLPDPVDAGPGYRRSKSADVIGTLIGVLGSQEVFIKEFQNIVADHLLKHSGGFEKEMKVLELLKSRFGDPPLQSCEVMLKDIHDSRALDARILRTTGSTMTDNTPKLHAKILSRFFWPALQDETFRVPEAIAQLQESYATTFCELKNARRLNWQHALGTVTVELELGDRVVLEQVHTWQATVIYAFNDAGGSSHPVRRQLASLEEELGMDQALLRSALNFWVGKSVLDEVEPDTYVVLETLDLPRSAPLAGAGRDTVSDSSTGVTGSHGTGLEAAATAKVAVYWQFIKGMLTNSQKEMAAAQIGMMLRMLIADGFPYSDAELADFLGVKVTEGELEARSGKYRLKK